MRRALVPVTFVTMVMLGIQLSVLSSLRFAGVVVMVIWLWTFCLGLAGYGVLALWAALVSGIFFDTHTTTPFGLTAVVGVLISFAATRLGREGVGDLDSAAWWVTPLLAAGAGFVAPLLYTISGFGALNFSLWRGSVGAMMDVNAVAFFFLARPVTRLAKLAGGAEARTQR